MAASKKINWHAIFMYLAHQVLLARQRVSASSWAFTDTHVREGEGEKICMLKGSNDTSDDVTSSLCRKNRGVFTKQISRV